MAQSVFKANQKLQNFAQAIGYQFIDDSLLSLALTHKSLLGKQQPKNDHGFNNERLEFLGDAVLSLVCAELLFAHEPHLNEGDLSRLRAQYVCRENLAEAGKRLSLGDVILSDKAMKRSGSTNSKAVLADALEAIIGAVFLDGGLENARRMILQILGPPKITAAIKDKDAKTKLQEIVQATTQSAPKYQVLGSSGPAHAPQYLVGVAIHGQIIAEALGENKKAAEQNAAVLALGVLQNQPKICHPAS